MGLQRGVIGCIVDITLPESWLEKPPLFDDVCRAFSTSRMVPTIYV